LLALVFAVAIQISFASRSLAATKSVSAFSFGFSPPSVTINVGDSVTWTGLGFSHNVQTDTDPFCGGVPVAGGTCTIQFNQAGTFNYYCAPHRFSQNMVGTVIVQAAANTAPSVTITNPVNGAVFAAQANVTVQATASDTDGNVTIVQLFANGTLVAADTAAPYSIVASNLAVGSYALRAVAMDNGGMSSTSSVVNISVVTPVSVALSPPLITNGMFQFNFTANAGLRYVIENSSNLPNWTAITTNTASSDNANFQETFDVNSLRFYRVGRLPNP